MRGLSMRTQATLFKAVNNRDRNFTRAKGQFGRDAFRYRPDKQWIISVHKASDTF